jgi:hypothetical protein
MKTKIVLISLVFIIGITLGGIAFGTPIEISGTGEYASFGGFLDYDPSSGTLTVSLENTTDETYSGEPWSDNGAITGIGFYFPELDVGQSLTSSFFTGDVNYPKFDVPKKLKGYDFGAGTGWGLWGGKVANGIKTGESAQFNFGFSGSIADFTSQDFVDALGPGPGGQSGFGVFKFKGIGPGTNYSDKIIPSGGGGAQVPEPATIFLLGSGLLGLFGYRKRFWKPKN